MSNDENVRNDKYKIGLIHYLILVFLLIAIIVASAIVYNVTTKTGSAPKEPEIYNVNFDIKDTKIDSLKVNEGGLITKPEDPSKTGYTFGGWFKDEACEYAWDFETDKVNADTTLYPKWTINSFIVSFDMQDHGFKIASQVIDYDGLVTKPTDPSEDGYTFGGWYKEETCENAWNFEESKVTADTSLYAKWVEVPASSYTVAFNLKGHGSAIDSQTIIEGGLVTKPTDPTETGYTFGGWYKDETLNFKWDFANDKVNSNTTLYAKWTAVPVIASYTVTFNLNGHGSTAIDSQVITEGGLVVSPTVPTDDDFTFGGWYKDALCEYKWDFANDTVNANTTLYAKWIGSYTVTFEINEAYADSKYSDYPDVEEPPLPQTIGYCGLVSEPTAPVDYYENFIFVGWYRDSSCVIEWDFANDLITKDATIYAKWAPKLCTVTFDLSGHDMEHTPDYQEVLYSNKVTDPGYTQPPIDMLSFPYSFQGWFYNDELWDFDNDVVTDNITIYARWIGVK